jgi:hypothetical protein
MKPDNKNLYIRQNKVDLFSFAMMSEREHLTTQKIYPVINNDDLLEFRIPANSKGQLDLSNVMIHFTTTIPHADDDAVVIRPQNFFGAKQFSSLEIRVNGESVTRKSCTNEFFLSNYFQHVCNYSSDYLTSAFRPAGVFDCDQTTSKALTAITASQKTAFADLREGTASNEFEIYMNVDTSIFGSTDLLPSNTAVDLSFERIGAEISAISMTTIEFASVVNELKDVYLTVPFVHDEETFHLERNAISRPLKINYDDYNIRRFNVPTGSTSVMLNNVMSGEMPSKLFWGLQDALSFGGSFNSSSTRFHQFKMSKVTLYLDGQEMSGFPISMTEEHWSVPYVNFLNNTNKSQNGLLSTTLSMSEYNNGNFILSHTLNRNMTGSLSFGFEFSEPVKTDLIMVTCGMIERTLKLDHNRNFQIV